MFPAALGRHVGNGPFEDLQQCLLNTFAGDIAGDGRVLGLPGDLVDLVDIDDAGLGAFDVEVGRLDEPEQDVLDIFTDIARFRQGRGVGHRKGDVQGPGQRLCQHRFTDTGGAEEQDVALLEFDVRLVAAEDALVVVVDRDRQSDLRALLTDDIFVQGRFDLLRFRQGFGVFLGPLASLCRLQFQVIVDEFHTELYALVADERIVHTGNELVDLVLRLTAEAAAKSHLVVSGQCRFPPFSLSCRGLCR